MLIRLLRRLFGRSRERPRIVVCDNCLKPNRVPPMQAAGTHRCGLCGCLLPGPPTTTP